MGRATIEKEYTVVVADANLFYPVEFAQRALLYKFGAVKVGAGSFNVDLYNRGFVSAPINIESITDNGGKLDVRLPPAQSLALPVGATTQLLARVGDDVTIASSSEATYNATAKILAISSDFRLVKVDITFVSAKGREGTIKLNVQAEGQLNNRVLAQQVVTNAVLHFPSLPYVMENHDIPLPDSSLRRSSTYYLKFSATGTYRIILGGITATDVS